MPNYVQSVVKTTLVAMCRGLRSSVSLMMVFLDRLRKLLRFHSCYLFCFFFLILFKIIVSCSDDLIFFFLVIATPY